MSLAVLQYSTISSIILIYSSVIVGEMVLIQGLQ